MPITLKQRHVLSVGAVRTFAIDFTDDLESGELLTGTPTVVEVTTSDLTISNKIVNTATLSILARTTVAVGAAVQFSMSGQQSGKSYRVRITANTTATPAQTLLYDILFDCI